MKPAVSIVATCYNYSPFLGYLFEAGHRYVRKNSFLAFRERIRQKTKRSRGVSVEQIIGEINPSLIGWFGYF